MKTSALSTSEIRCFHDGDCPLCSLEVGIMRRLDENERIDWIDIHSGSPMMEQAAISHEQAMAALHVVDMGGRVVSGVNAFLLLWERLPVYRHLAALIKLAPWLFPMLELIYAGFARVRPSLVRLSRRPVQRQHPAPQCRKT